jgi:hypothetical protein
VVGGDGPPPLRALTVLQPFATAIVSTDPHAKRVEEDRARRLAVQARNNRVAEEIDAGGWQIARMYGLLIPPGGPPKLCSLPADLTLSEAYARGEDAIETNLGPVPLTLFRRYPEAFKELFASNPELFAGKP